MKLGQLKQYIESLPDGTMFDFSLSYPFSWRGVYAEVAYSVKESPSQKEELLHNVNAAYDGPFIGYKGGDFYYDDDTQIHFEEGQSAWSDGRYTEDWISKLLHTATVASPEERLVSLLFPNK